MNIQGEKYWKDESSRLLSSSIFQLPLTLVVSGKDGDAIYKNVNVLFCSVQSETMLSFPASLIILYIAFSSIES